MACELWTTLKTGKTRIKKGEALARVARSPFGKFSDTKNRPNPYRGNERFY
jgi:hypothetical protein